MEEVIDTQPFRRSTITFLLTSPEWWLIGTPSFKHSSYFSNVQTMSLKSGRFDGFPDQQRFIRCASAGSQLAGRGGLSFWSKTKITFQIKNYDLDQMNYDFQFFVFHNFRDKWLFICAFCVGSMGWVCLMGMH